MAKYAREGFRGDAQLRRNQALALVQRDAHGAGRILLGMVQQPLGTACFRVVGQAAHGQFRLLAIARRHVEQQATRPFGHGGQALAKLRNRHPAQLHTRFSHHVYRQGQAQQRRCSVEPERAFHRTQLVPQVAFFIKAAQHPPAFQVQHRGEHLITPAQHFAGGKYFRLDGQGK